MQITPKNNTVNIRAFNNTSSNIISTLKKGEVISVIRETSKINGFKWFAVQVNSSTGYIREDVVNIVQESKPIGKKLTYLVIHCTATPEGREVTKEDIIKWHTSPVSKGGRGWSVVGYSRMINLKGDLITMHEYNENDLVEPWEVTNGASGINSISRHIVYAGGLDKTGKKAKDTRTVQQKETMKTFILDTIKKHPNILIAGHYHFANKACPSFNVEEWCKEIGVPTKNIYKK